MGLDANHLTGMTQLTFLAVWGGKIKNSQALSSLTGLPTLVLFDPEVDLAFLETMTELRDLTLSGFPGADLSPVGRPYNLNRLYLSRVQLQDIRWMCGLRNLQTLELYSTQISDLSFFPPLPKLTKLSLKGNLKQGELGSILRQQYPGVGIIT